MVSNTCFKQFSVEWINEYSLNCLLGRVSTPNQEAGGLIDLGYSAEESEELAEGADEEG